MSMLIYSLLCSDSALFANTRPFFARWWFRLVRHASSACLPGLLRFSTTRTEPLPASRLAPPPEGWCWYPAFASPSRTCGGPGGTFRNTLQATRLIGKLGFSPTSISSEIFLGWPSWWCPGWGGQRRRCRCCRASHLVLAPWFWTP